MLHVILGILKVIGILLLAAAGLMVLCLLAVLFVPVRYRIAGKKEGQLLEGHIQVSWLLHVIGLAADYREGQLEIKLKLFGFVLKHIGGEKGFDEDKKMAPGKNPAKAIVEKIQPIPEKLTDTGADLQSKRKTETDGSVADAREWKSEKDDVPDAGVQEKKVLEEKSKEEKFRTFGRTVADKMALPIRKVIWIFQRAFRLLVKVFEFILYLPERILDWVEKVSDILDAGENALEKLEKIRNDLCKKAKPFLTDASRALYRRLLGHVKYLWKCYGPRKIQGWAQYGTGAPDITGQLTGLLYMLLPASADQFELLPDFTETVLEADMVLKGHIRACHLVKIAFLLWRDKQLRRLIRKVRAKGGQQNGR